MIIDLEDSIAAADKGAARAHARDWLASGNPAMLRVNGSATEWYRADAEVVDDFGPAVKLPKSRDGRSAALGGGAA